MKQIHERTRKTEVENLIGTTIPSTENRHCSFNTLFSKDPNLENQSELLPIFLIQFAAVAMLKFFLQG